MTPKRTDVPWWADYLRDAMRSWGLGVVIVVGTGALVGAFLWQHGARWIDAKIVIETSNAETFKNVATAVTRLTQLADDNADFQKEVQESHDKQTNLSDRTLKIMEEAKSLMQSVPDERREANRLLSELLAATKAKQ